MTRCTDRLRARLTSPVRIFVIPLVALYIMLTGCWKEPGKFNWGNAPGAEQYERLMWQAIREKDWAEVEHHLAPTFVGVGAEGKQFDVPGWLGYWKGLQVSNFSIGELAVAANGPDMVVTYDLQLNGASAPASPLRVVSVWQQVKKGWILISQSEIPVKAAGSN